MAVTRNQQNIYNTYLATTRSLQNKPFRLRSNFDKFEESPNYPLVIRLERLFKEHPEIKTDQFFKAPYALHPSEAFDLNFYASFKAVSYYRMYMKLLDALPYDDEYHLNAIGDSLKFIKDFCIENKINVADYPSYSEGLYPAWLRHAKHRYIDLAVMFGFPQTRQIMEAIEPDMVSLFIPEFYNSFYSNSTKFKHSSKAKLLVRKGVELLSKKNKYYS